MSVLSFVEESCWDGESFRPVRKAVTFRIVSVGKINGLRVDHMFEADYGIWYDPEDRYLIRCLEGLNLGIDWGQFVFWRRPDRIEVLEVGEEEKLIASIAVRKRMGGDPSGEEDTTNLVSYDQFRLAREKRVGTESN